MKISYAKLLHSTSPFDYKLPKKSDFEKSNSEFIIVSNTWDDYYSKTSCFLFTLDNGTVVNIGSLKIAILGSTNTHKYFSDNFKDDDYINILDNLFEFYSLGQEKIYYEKLSDLYKSESENLLKKLNDISIISISKSIVQDPNYSDSILRTKTAKTLYENAPKIISNTNLNLNFDVKFKLPVFNNEHILEFDFNDKLLVYKEDKLNNIHLLIGENGVGKTQVLKKIHDNLNTYEKNPNTKTKIPPFGNYIFISSSPFSNFKSFFTKKTTPRINYTYINLLKYQRYSEKFSKHILEIFKYDIKNCNFNEKFFKTYSLLEITRIALGEDVNFKILQFNEDNLINHEIIIDDDFVFEDHFESILSFFDDKKKIKFKILYKDNLNEIKLSSGQRSFLIQIFSILDRIKLNTLILIDEPESFLHPTFEIIFIRFFREILNRFDSYAIIATHSTIICREVPSKFISILKKNTNKEIKIKKLSFETLGYDLTEIYNHVYNGVLEKTYYEEWLINYIKKDRTLSDEEFINKYNQIFESNILTKLLYLKNYYE